MVGTATSGRFPAKPPGMHTGHTDSKRDARRAKRAGPLPGVPQPEGNSEWHPIVASFWRSIGKTPEGKWLQPVDWMTIWVAMDIFDSMYANDDFNAGLVREATRMVTNIIPPRAIPEMTPESQGNSDEDTGAEILQLFSGGDDE